MDLGEIGDASNDVFLRAKALRDEFDTLKLKTPRGTDMFNELVAIGLSVSGLMAKAHGLHTMIGTARMTGDLPAPPMLGAAHQKELEAPAEGFQRTRSPAELQARFAQQQTTYDPAQDHKMAAAGDHSLDDR